MSKSNVELLTLSSADRETRSSTLANNCVINWTFDVNTRQQQWPVFFFFGCCGSVINNRINMFGMARGGRNGWFDCVDWGTPWHEQQLHYSFRPSCRASPHCYLQIPRRRPPGHQKYVFNGGAFPYFNQPPVVEGNSERSKGKKCFVETRLVLIRRPSPIKLLSTCSARH